jgi:hypothetical protein
MQHTTPRRYTSTYNKLEQPTAERVAPRLPATATAKQRQRAGCCGGSCASFELSSLFHVRRPTKPRSFVNFDCDLARSWFRVLLPPPRCKGKGKGHGPATGKK